MRRGSLKTRLLFGVAIAAFFAIKYCSQREINEYTGRTQAISITTEQEIQ